MPEENKVTSERKVRVRHLGHRGQIGVYFGKMLRMFLYQGDWLVLPMAALIAGLVGVVIAGSFYVYMEGTMISALAITCACLWNGCFNSIQVICRERGVIKREHRSGLHITSYIIAHMMYQALLCIGESVISLYMFRLIGVSFPDHGVIFSSFILEFFITMLLITYAADMMALWISALSKTTTTAMTIMPVVLIFQLVFSGGMMRIPKSLEVVQDFTISSWGMRMISVESDYNSQPLSTAWNSVWGMRNTELNATVTVGQVLEFIEGSDSNMAREIRETKLIDDDSLFGTITVDEVAEMLRTEEDAEELREQQIELHTTIGELMDIVGAEKVRSFILDTTSAAAFNEDYVYTPENAVQCWLVLLLFTAAFAVLATVTLEFIDRDKR